MPARRAPSQPVTKPPRPNKQRATSVIDEVALARRRKARERAVVARYVDDRLDAMECEELYAVPHLYVAVTGSLAPAHLLVLVARWSERCYAETGSPWVRRPVQTWVDQSGLPEPDWLAARDALREQGLIDVRRRFDLATNEIVPEIAFVPSAFAAAVAKVREEIREAAWDRVREGHDL